MERGNVDLPIVTTGRVHSFITDVEPQTAHLKPSIFRLEKVTEVHSLLLDKVNSLNDFINEVLKRQEREYLKAVQMHMTQMNTQIKQLKNKAGVKQMEMKKEEEMTKLQESLAWVKEEALKLERTCSKLRDDCTHWKLKAEGLESDRKFLEKQLKQAMRQLRAYESEGRKEEMAKPLPMLFKQTVGVKVELPPTKAGQLIGQLVAKYSPSDPELFSQLEAYMTSQEDLHRSTLRHYQRILSSEKRKIDSLNSTFSSSYMVKSDLETLFFECVEEVRKAATKRMHTSYGHRRNGSTAYEKEAHLTAADKVKILELLVDNEQVLILLHQHLFPHRKLGSREQAQPVADLPEEQLHDLVLLSKTFEDKSQLPAA